MNHSPSLAGILALLLAPSLSAASVPAPSEYGEPTFRVRVEDRLHRPLSGLRIRAEVGLQGRARQETGPSQPIITSLTRFAVTDAGGTATIRVEDPSGWPAEPMQWFTGRAAVRITPADPHREITPLWGTAFNSILPVPSLQDSLPLLSLVCFEEPDLKVDGFPIWLGQGRQLNRVLVILEGFDFYNNTSATDVMAIIAGAGDQLRAAGISILSVNFPDAHLAPDALAPFAARAVQAAASASRHRVALAGLSSGGIVGRWALVDAENHGNPLPVHTFLSLDSPNRGARLNPVLEAFAARYGRPIDRLAIRCPSAQVLIRKHPANVRWKFLGLRPLGAEIPARWDEEGRANEEFFSRLRHLNDRGGYPHQCRLVGVATGSRRTPSGSGDLLHLWVPFGYDWTLKAEPEDHAPGSILPRGFQGAFHIRFPLGLAGIYMRSSPTFIPTESALDAGPDETSPFDEWYARPDGLPPLPHDRVDAGEIQFILQEVLKGDWSSGV